MKWKSARFCLSGLTILETLIAISVISILITLVSYGYEPVLNKAQSMLCISRMRSIQSGLSANLSDKGTWSNPPDTLSADQHADWWIQQLIPYGVPAAHWICPTAKKIFASQQNSPQPQSSYAVSMFDKGPFAPKMWPRQPWLVEIVGVHKNGPHICFQDGSVQSLNQLLTRK